MKQLQKLSLLALFLAVVAGSCGRKESGQLVGVTDRPKWKGINPYGMVYIPSGTLHVGASDEDMSRTQVARPKTITVQGFFMDETEITNNEYRQLSTGLLILLRTKPFNTLLKRKLKVVINNVLTGIRTSIGRKALKNFRICSIRVMIALAAAKN